MKNLNSQLWPEATDLIRQCHLSHAGIEAKSVDEWKKAYALLTSAIEDERKSNMYFAPELNDLDDNTEITYSFADILEEYFDYLEENEQWQDVVDSCKKLIDLFQWTSNRPSQYYFRIGNALEQLEKFDEAEAFGKEWLAAYPDDLFAAAANVYLLCELDRYEEAEALTEKYLNEDLVCDDKTQTIYMAAYRLYELTDNVNAKQRVSKKIADYNALIGK